MVVKPWFDQDSYNIEIKSESHAGEVSEHWLSEWVKFKLHIATTSGRTLVASRAGDAGRPRETAVATPSRDITTSMKLLRRCARSRGDDSLAFLHTPNSLETPAADIFHQVEPHRIFAGSQPALATNPVPLR